MFTSDWKIDYKLHITMSRGSLNGTIQNMEEKITANLEFHILLNYHKSVVKIKINNLPMIGPH